MDSPHTFFVENLTYYLVTVWLLTVVFTAIASAFVGVIGRLREPLAAGKNVPGAPADEVAGFRSGVAQQGF